MIDSLMGMAGGGGFQGGSAGPSTATGESSGENSSGSQQCELCPAACGWLGARNFASCCGSVGTGLFSKS